MDSQPLLKERKISNSCSSESVSSSPTPGYEYELFLSFRGPDTRKGFTDFLYNSLKDAGVRVFRDDEDLRKGEEIGPELLEAIQQSKISIPIFSKDYASSKWCLKELAQMVECRKTTKQMILPIFYDVAPNQVRDQTAESCYSEAFSQHMKKYDEQTIQQWRDALAEVGALKGWDLNSINGYEGELVKLVVKDVLGKLKKAHLIVTEQLVGIDDHVGKVMRLLEIGAKDVRAVGLWGMGGIGKTTLAKFIYNLIVKDFDCYCFLDDVRETSKQKGIKSLQSSLVTNLSRSADEDFTSVDEGINVLRTRFREKKVLILLDDVGQIEQLDKLVVELDAYGPGSRIIVTTRDREVLKGSRFVASSERTMNLIYEVEEMNKDKAFQLFSSHAFHGDSPPIELGSIPEDICKTTGGLPLALEVIGSYLSDKTKYVWEATLEKLKQVPHSAVLEKLMISYEALDHRQKQIFLDIACLFIGEIMNEKGRKKAMFDMWKDCKFCPEDGLDVLIRISLVKIKEDDTLWMHDQLRDLGREIARNNREDDPGKWSRLWDYEDARQVIEDPQGSSTVQAIRLRYPYGIDPVPLEQFGNLPELRYLEMEDVDLAGDFSNRLPKLRWLKLYYSSVNCAASLCLKNLVVLEMQFCISTIDWKDLCSAKMMKLKVLDLTGNPNLRIIPCFCASPNLERLILQSCPKLEKVDRSIWNLQKLSYLNMNSCVNVEALPAAHQSVDKISAMRTLDISGCFNLKRLPNLSIFNCLERLFASRCGKLEELSGVQHLDALEELHIQFCVAIKKLPSLKNLKLLHTLDARYCKKLRELEGFDHLESLKWLKIDGCEALEKLASLKNLKCLEELDARNCKKLQELEGLDHLEALKWLNIDGCEALEKLANLKNLKFLEKLDAQNCKKLQELEGLDHLEALKWLDIEGCEAIEKLPSLKKLKMLSKFNARNCKKLQKLEGLDLF